MLMKNKGKNKLDNSRDLQIWIWSNKPAIKGSADFIFSKMKRAEITFDFKDNRLKNHLKVILTDLFVAHRNDKKLYQSAETAMTIGSIGILARFS